MTEQSCFVTALVLTLAAVSAWMSSPAFAAVLR
jgi:hypothetical protein